MNNFNPAHYRRLPAEWEKQGAVQVTFPHKNTDWADMLDEVIPCFVEIVEAISRFEKVLIVCQNAQETRALLTKATPANLIFFEADSNDSWARDHGGITIVDVEYKEYVILDFVFNGWGNKYPAEKDNLITKKLRAAGFFDLMLNCHHVVLEGGAIESDGKGTMLTTSKCLIEANRNPKMPIEDIEDWLKITFGLKQVLWLRHGYLAGDDTDSHIDTLARFCNTSTIAYVHCPDPQDEHYEALKLMETELKGFKTKGGKPYNLVPLPWPDACYDNAGNRLPATYANFLIINRAVLVPTYQVSQDEEALKLFKELFPTRKVIGINCRPLIEQHGSLHCVTMQYPLGAINLNKWRDDAF